MKVIGVVADVRDRGLREEMHPQVYFPFAAALGGPLSAQLSVKSSVPPMTLLGGIRRQLNALDPGLALVRPRTMEDVIAEGMTDTRLQTWLLTAFAALAVVLACVGLYSVMAFLVAERRHEIGVRTALGAAPTDLLRLVFSHAAKLVVAGLLAGVAGALGLTRLIRTLLFGVTPGDVPTYATVSLLLALVALVACAVPARRATRVDPIVALRVE